jgi:hypothetical protein
VPWLLLGNGLPDQIGEPKLRTTEQDNEGIIERVAAVGIGSAEPRGSTAFSTVLITPLSVPAGEVPLRGCASRDGAVAAGVGCEPADNHDVRHARVLLPMLTPSASIDYCMTVGTNL